MGSGIFRSQCVFIGNCFLVVIDFFGHGTLMVMEFLMNIVFSMKIIFLVIMVLLVVVIFLK